MSKLKIDNNFFISLIMDLAAIIIIVSSYIDYRVIGILGVRLNWQVVTMCDDPGQLWKLFVTYINQYLLVCFAVMIIGFKLFQLLISSKMNYFNNTRKSWVYFFLTILI
ncbi:hypothetical protein KAJ27_16775, partial [bacterium]|nr:hypothetical protein [bacterium]